MVAPRVHQRTRLQLEFGGQRRHARVARAQLARIDPSLAAGDALVRDVSLPRRVRRQRAVLAGRGVVGRRIFGGAIAQPLAMRLAPSATSRVRQLVEPCLALIGTAMVLALLVSVRARRLLPSFALVAVTLTVAFFHDASFLGGVRPFESGDDGLVYDGYAR